MSGSQRKRIRIGCQSWGYDDWVTPAGGPYVFYPPGTKKKEMLPFYAKVFDTVEVDATVYGIPAASTLEKWYSETPTSFKFSLKTPREITHEGRLSASTISTMIAFVERAKVLREKLGILLIQLSPHFEPDRENAQNLREFMSELPRDCKYAVEFRDPNWFVDRTFQELEQTGVTLAMVEGPWIRREVMFAANKDSRACCQYIRVMSSRDLQKFDRIYRHRDEELNQWVNKIEQFSATEIYIYVDNYFEGFAPGTALKLQERLGITTKNLEEVAPQPSLFD